MGEGGVGFEAEEMGGVGFGDVWGVHEGAFWAFVRDMRG